MFFRFIFRVIRILSTCYTGVTFDQKGLRKTVSLKKTPYTRKVASQF